MPSNSDSISCSQAGHQAEQEAAIPTNLLISIGMIESGKADPSTGKAAPWPWTVNADGAGHYFNSKADAITYVQSAQSSGAQDIDVGCFQVSLESHPSAFASLDQAFDPGANATFAASYLTELKGQTGSWDTAVADYHSANPIYGLPYQREVFNAWQNGGGIMPAGSNELSPMNINAPDPYVIMQTQVAKEVHIITPESSFGGGLHLPRVSSP